MKFIWPEAARSELRAIDRETALRILYALTEFAKQAKGISRRSPADGKDTSRLRIGDYGVMMAIAPEGLTVVRVRHRSEAYR
jgi:mRNA-degrading endonuclease RelE of RelBE toxin-antitoxin system